MDPLLQQIERLLRGVRYPGFSRDIVDLGVVREIRATGGGGVEVELRLGAGQAALQAPLERAIKEAASSLAGLTELRVVLGDRTGGSAALRLASPTRSVAAAGALDSTLISGVRHAVAVASGKGGVGKSTIAVNLAVALARGGSTVGLLDADVYGPSVPLMTGISERPEVTADRRIVPFERFGLRIMSLGFSLDPEAAVIWRGPLVMKAIVELLGNVAWGELDYLVVDLPPGTGDVQLTLSQKVRLAGAVIVTTPQDVALADARRGIAMFRKVDVPVLGIVENMSYFECPQCSARADLFGHGGGRAEAERQGVPFLGEVPLHPAIRLGGDRGEPIVWTDPEAPQAKALVEIAERVHTSLGGPRTPPGGTGLFERFRRALGRDRG